MKNFQKVLYLGFLLFSSLAFAHVETYTLDSVHSSVSFKIRHLIGKVTGSFPAFTGTLNFDAEDIALSSVTAEIDAGSINTQNTKRDDHLKSPDFFDVAKFPKLNFKSSKIRKAETGKYQIDGELTIHGVKKAVTLEMVYNGISKGMMGELRAGFSATTKINRKDFGIVWNKTLDAGGLVIGDDVDVVIEIEAVKEVKIEAVTEAKKEMPKAK
jgi:polyisoprenoid-binding protein YceI